MGSTVRKAIHIGLFTGLVALSGCGGGGSDSSTAPAATTRPIATNNLRIYQNGDNITYDLIGEVRVAGVLVDQATGTKSVSTTINSGPQTLSGVSASLQTTVANTQGSNGATFTSSSDVYFLQSTSGAFNVYGNGLAGWITSPASGFYPQIKSPIQSPDSWAGFAITQNGATTNYTVTVLGKSVVTTGLGAFEAYQFEFVNRTYDAIGNSTGTMTAKGYIVPSIGVIKEDLTIITTDPVTGSQTEILMIATMSTTNIPF